MAIRSRPSPARAFLAGAVSMLIGAGALVSLEGSASAAGVTGHPAHNTSPSGLRACDPHSFDDSAACLSGALADYDRARRAEGITKPMTLPGNYASLTAPRQLLTLTNIDRIDHGLPPLAGLSAKLNASAKVGATRGGDPLPPKDIFADGVMSYRVGSNWASPLNPLWVEFLWMYDDGPGSGNLDCRSAADAGCWGHRDNILAPYGRKALMGAATGATGTAAIYVDRDPQYTDVVYAWPSASGSSATKHRLVVAGKKGRIVGRARVGRVLTARLPAVHVDSARGPIAKGVRARFSWLRDGHRIPHATGRRYHLDRADRRHRVAFRVVLSGPAYRNTPTYTSGSVRVRR